MSNKQPPPPLQGVLPLERTLVWLNCHYIFKNQYNNGMVEEPPLRKQLALNDSGKIGLIVETGETGGRGGGQGFKSCCKMGLHWTFYHGFHCSNIKQVRD